MANLSLDILTSADRLVEIPKTLMDTMLGYSHVEVENTVLTIFPQTTSIYLSGPTRFIRAKGEWKHVR